MKKTVSFHTLGCRLNMSETGAIAQGFVDRGYEVVSFGNTSDVTFLNTCTVTDGADSTCRNLIRKAQKNSPEGKVVVAGCYAQMEAEKIKAMQGVDLILGTQEKYKVFDYLTEEEEGVIKIDKSTEFWGAATTQADNHTRSFLKVQDGCNYVCSFCIIPFARGRSRTITVADAVTEATKLVGSGFNEIVLTGVNIGEYESTSGERLVDLVQGIADVDGLKRLRLSSVEPNTISRELLETLSASGIYQDHFHIPMQSGCNEILTLMRRKYNKEFYRNTIKLIREFFPNTSIGADIIVGYPGETRDQFKETFEFLEELNITHFHVFPYSKRKNTTAAKEANHIQADEKKMRVKTLINLGEAQKNAFAKTLIGKESDVLFERQKDGTYLGHCSQYIKVKHISQIDLRNKIKRMRFIDFDGDALTGEILEY